MIGGCVALETLGLSACKSLAALPETLGLSDCKSLAALPEAIGGCVVLKMPLILSPPA